MGYQRGYDRSRERGDTDRWRDRGNRSYGERGQSDYGQRDYTAYDRDRTRDFGRSDDRGMFDRGFDEVRSWFGDEEAERRREADQRRYEREHGYSGDRSRFGGGYQGSDAPRSTRDYPRGDFEQDSSYAGTSSPGTSADTWDSAGFGGNSDRGRRFDRGSTGTNAAGYGIGTFGATQGSARYGGDPHDQSYSEWRNRQIDTLDRDYDDYRRENQSRFEQEFGGWREKRQGQRNSLRNVAEHMEVVGSDGDHVGTVDKVRGDRILLTKSDPDAGGKHHSIPCGWIESVDDKVVVSKTAAEAQAAWKDEEHSRALFESDDQGRGGPGVLNRSFSGTY